jgi:hypothetical protein
MRERRKRVGESNDDQFPQLESGGDHLLAESRYLILVAVVAKQSRFRPWPPFLVRPWMRSSLGKRDT